MADAYTTRNRFTMPPKGSYVDNWAVPVNGNTQLIDQAMDGMATIALAALTTYSLTTANGATDQARNRVLNFTGTQPCTVTLPAVEKLYTVINGLGTGLALTFTIGTGTTTVIPSGETAQIYASAAGVQLVTSSREWRQAASVGPSGATITSTIGTGDYFDSSQLELRQIGHDDVSSQSLMLSLETSTPGTYGTAIAILATVAAASTERVYGNISIENKGSYIDIVSRVGKTAAFTNPLLQVTSTSFTASLASMGSNRGIRLSWSGAVNFNNAQGSLVRYQR